ncbi:zinc finger CCCH domain-containing protein 3 isoform X1 [Denticeps clupeoides]|uniref:zinc finger CCCH domain-containing protein 3 isoform X1 n=1 Tax=Denticeps clupeoides TaxID=299321 RepID=UPI0010A40D8A|nr:zinc finger CCCH domain-containing protein 3 isoform X1 [Denticeps clupeoides]
MEEREAIKRQIELLQNLIDNHKNAHGDTQPSTFQRPGHEWHQDHRTNTPFSASSQPYAHRSVGQWRKTYSLSNKTLSISTGPRASTSTSYGKDVCEPSTSRRTGVSCTANDFSHQSEPSISSGQSRTNTQSLPSAGVLSKPVGSGPKAPYHSQFTWVKSQSNRSTEQVQSQTDDNSWASIRRETSHRPSVSSAAQISKYTWVCTSTSSTCSATKACQNLLSHRTTNETRKVYAEDLVKRKKLSSLSSFAGTTRKVWDRVRTPVESVSHYSWKAGEQTCGLGSNNCRSDDQGSIWGIDKVAKKLKAGTGSYLHLPLNPSAFRLRRRMKIVRNNSTSTVAVQRRLPGRSQVFGPHSSFPTAKRCRTTPARVFVSFDRHKLHNLPYYTSHTGFYSTTTQMRFYTRYKIDTRKNTIWRIKRVQSARMLLQSRLRASPDRHWKGQRMRWIGGELYQVSANKLSRTQNISTSTYRTVGKLCGAQTVSSPNNSRPYTARHIASRAVQRSLAVIRQAHQRRRQQPSQYCMYYNRFGKCNRGHACPFIHDPDKVAVCTRFLRGTCKQTDGTCPFSHKVSKEKMPVCSYFLRGICNNSSCPYSHVYVSHKATVCQDFIRGYCPQGETCKKKHTLVCPSFSMKGFCPRGTKCKLLHRQSAFLNRVHEPTICKQTSTPNLSKSIDSQIVEEMPISGPVKLPSFISLSSSQGEESVHSSLSGSPVSSGESQNPAQMLSMAIPVK